MPRYMVQASYTAAAAAAFVSEPQDRVQGVRDLLGRMGGTLDSFDYCLGDYDAVIRYTAPDDTTAAAIALAVIGAGHMQAYKTTKLLSPDEFMQAMQKAGGVSYQPPSRG